MVSRSDGTVESDSSSDDNVTDGAAYQLRYHNQDKRAYMAPAASRQLRPRATW